MYRIFFLKKKRNKNEEPETKKNNSFLKKFIFFRSRENNVCGTFGTPYSTSVFTFSAQVDVQTAQPTPGTTAGGATHRPGHATSVSLPASQDRVAGWG